MMQTISEKEFLLLKEFLYKKTGISLNSHKKPLLFNRLYQRINELKINSFQDYYHLLAKQDVKGEELAIFIDAITTNKTFFFRSIEHFNFLSNTIIPELTEKKRLKGKKKISIWSSASSSGEEAYTIAMASFEALKRCGDFSLWTLKIFATDINQTVLKFAKEGTYKETQLKGVPLDIKKEYFLQMQQTDHYIIKNIVKNKVSFSYHNLKNPLLKKKFDVIFCRNVMIYFDSSSKKNVVTNLYNCLNPEGYIIVGQSETLADDDRFSYIIPSVFKKK